MNLAKEYGEIARLIGSSLGDEMGRPYVVFRVKGDRQAFYLDTIDGLMEVWGGNCWGWEWFRKMDMTPQGSPVDEWLVMIARNKADGEPDPITPQWLVCSGNFHADFCRLLVAVLREINERTKGS